MDGLTKDERRRRLARRFRRQQSFAEDTSPLAACLCGIVADWLEVSSGDDQVATWLLDVSRECSSFAVPMLLMAALHRQILAGAPGMRSLAEFFPSVGGLKAVSAPAIEPQLRAAILAHQPQLALFIRSATVQTNETARGLCWVLPVLYAGWASVNVIDLGCSAGLNLVADQRHYRLLGENCAPLGVDIGLGQPEQFVLSCSGDFVPPPTTTIPGIFSRTGCDQRPLPLADAEDELDLASFVWGDQLHRLKMLRLGIAALRRVGTTDAPVRLVAAHLPDDLPLFLAQSYGSGSMEPMVICTTYLTPYLDQQGAAFGEHIAQWAGGLTQPVVWLQWEPIPQGPRPPVLGWLGWTADLWIRRQHHHWLLAWVHPHGAAVQWLPGLKQWAHFWQSQGKRRTSMTAGCEE
jgi:hypothetical protein